MIKRSSRCCTDLNRYTSWYSYVQKEYRKCWTESSNLQKEVGALKDALKSTDFVLHVAPHKDRKPATPYKLERVRTDLIRKLQSTKFNFSSGEIPLTNVGTNVKQRKLRSNGKWIGTGDNDN